jgi:ABC-type multidrug transport system ATPase subunit
MPFNNLTVSANVIYINDQMNFPTALTLKEILNVSATFYENWNHELASRLFDYFSFQSTHYYNDLSKGMKSTFNMIGIHSQSIHRRETVQTCNHFFGRNKHPLPKNTEGP